MRGELGEERLARELLAVALGLSLWVALGSFVIAVAEGLGPRPALRLLSGVLLVAGSAVGLWRRDRVAAVLRARPWLVVPVATAELGVAALDGLLDGPFVAFCATSVALAAVVARPRTVWLCVAVLVAGHATAVLVERAPAALVRSGDLDGVLGALCAYPCTALVALAFVRLYAGFVGRIEPTLELLRAGAPALTPALTRAIEQGGGRRPLALLPAPRRLVCLTPKEIEVVEGLASGRAPKELAHHWGVSLATVRTHIMHAKRKTGARSLPELAALTGQPGWPDVVHRGE
jgi:DNA-binding CsgD family transcriptional regulator